MHFIKFHQHLESNFVTRYFFQHPRTIFFKKDSNDELGNELISRGCLL